MVTDARAARRVVRAVARIEHSHDRALKAARRCLECAYVVWAAEIRLDTVLAHHTGEAKVDPVWMGVRKRVRKMLKLLAGSCQAALSRDETRLARILWVLKCALHGLRMCRPEDCWIRAREHAASPYQEDTATGCAVVEVLRLATALPPPEELYGSQAQGWAEHEPRRFTYDDIEW